MVDGVTIKESSEPIQSREINRRESSAIGKQKTETVNAEPAKNTEKNNPETRNPETKNVEEAIANIDTIAKHFNRKIKLEVEKDLNIMVVKVVDGETEQVIRQIPSEEIIALSKHARDLKGLLIDKEG